MIFARSAEKRGRKMTIMETGKAPEDVKVEGAESVETASPDGAKSSGYGENVFSDANIAKGTKVSAEDIKKAGIPELAASKDITLTPEDKAAFIDAVANNSRFTRNYSLFGGKITLTIRSLTSDEVNAMSAWMVRRGSSDSAGVLAGRYRKYLVAAQVSKYNGVEMPPLENPLFETLASDGKTVNPPGWIKRCDFWDGIGSGVFTAIMGCITDFDSRYAVLCSKAEDSNFWSPDTH